VSLAVELVVPRSLVPAVVPAGPMSVLSSLVGTRVIPPDRHPSRCDRPAHGSGNAVLLSTGPVASVVGLTVRRRVGSVPLQSRRRACATRMEYPLRYHRSSGKSDRVVIRPWYASMPRVRGGNRWRVRRDKRSGVTGAAGQPSDRRSESATGAILDERAPITNGRTDEPASIGAAPSDPPRRTKT